GARHPEPARLRGPDLPDHPGGGGGPGPGHRGGLGARRRILRRGGGRPQHAPDRRAARVSQHPPGPRHRRRPGGRPPRRARRRRGRGVVLELRKVEYVAAARALGESDLSVMVRYVLPGTLAPVIVLGSLRMATVLLAASGLNFLGLGVQPPSPEWGAMLSNAR